MLTFKTFVLAEAGDKPYDYKVHEEDQEGTLYHFQADKTPYTVNIEHMGTNHMTTGHAEVSFGVRHHDVDFGDHTSFHLTGEQGSKAAKILSTVHHIVKRHIEKHPEIHTVGFTSDTNEPSRVALYKRYTNRLGGINHESPRVYDTMVHTIPADSYRK